MKAVESGDFTILDLFDTLPWFRGAADWTAWRAFLCALYALPMTSQELAIYQECTGRQRPPSKPAREVWAPTGRRARKSAIAALIAVFEGGFRDYTPFLAPGERANIPIIGKNKKEAEQISTFVRAILADDSLRHLLQEEPGVEKIRLITRVDLNIIAVSLTAGRSKSNVLALLDEVAFFATEGAVPDIEVVRGIKPGMSTIPDAKLFGLSSPWGKRGLLYDNYKAYHASRTNEDGREVYDADKERAADRARVLVWKAPTLRMHKTAQLEGEIAQAYEADPISAAAEYGAEFREDTDAFVLERILDAAIRVGRKVLGYVAGRNYFAFVDTSGGSSDSLALAIAHFEPETMIGPPEPTLGLVRLEKPEVPKFAGRVILDFTREWPGPFDPEDVTAECADSIKAYGLSQCMGDQYAGKWPVSNFHRHGVAFGWSTLSKNDLYREFLPLLNMGQVELLDDPTMKAQFLVLDRKVARGGRETIDHAPGGHDDVANAVAGAVVLSKMWGPTMRVKKVETPATTTTELMKRRVADMLDRERKNAGGHRNVHRRRK